MEEGSSDATALLGMDGFVVLVMERIEGEWWLLVETSATVAGCPDCGVVAIGHGRGTVQVRDLPNGSGPVRLVWRKRRWRCPDPDCERRTFTERSELVEGSLTRRARAEICRAVGEGGHTVAEQARRFGIGWSTAMTAVRDHGRPLVEDDRRLHRVRTLGSRRAQDAGCRSPAPHRLRHPAGRPRPWSALGRRPRPERRSRSRDGWASAPATGVTTSTSSPSIPTAAITMRSSRDCRGRPSPSITSMRSSWPTGPSTTSVVESSARRSAIVAGRTIPSMAPAD